MENREDEKEIKKQLDNFVIAPELEELEDKLCKMNFLEVLGVSDKENVHSNFLKWLLDPREIHGLSDYFLKKFLEKVLMKGKTAIPNISVVDIDVANLNDAIVRREEPLKGRADITIESESNKIYCLIENKLQYVDDEAQFRRYYEATISNYPKDYTKIFVYLNPEDAPLPSDLPFIPFGYGDMSGLIEDLLKRKKMDDGVAFMIRQYLQCVKDDILGAEEIDELCLKIYQTHKKAIDRIIESLPEDVETYEKLGDGVIKELGTEWEKKARNSYCAVFKKDWLNKLEKISWRDLPVVHYEFNDVAYNKLKIGFHVEYVGRGDDFRDKFVKILEDLAKNPEIKRSLDGWNFTSRQVLFSRVVIRNWSRNPDEENINHGIKEMTNFIKKTEKVVDKAVKKFTEDTVYAAEMLGK